MLPPDPARRFARFAWGVLLYTLLVIAWGAYVRASGAGAGCGDHWPLCNGVVVPRAPALATVIEFTHRLMSALLGFLVLGLVVAAYRTFPKGTGVRAPAVLTGVFTVTEALIGAGLVLFQYVAFNVSLARAYWMAAHLVNTFLLLGALAVTVHRASVHAGLLRPEWLPPISEATRRALAVSVGGLVVLGCSGAVTALGDTLVIAGGIDPLQEPIVRALVGMRLYHPLLAFLVGTVVTLGAVLVRVDAPRTRTARLAGLVVLLMCAQMAVGGLNVYLHAPIWLQIVHLLVTDGIWMGVVVLADLTRDMGPVETGFYDDAPHAPAR